MTTSPTNQTAKIIFEAEDRTAAGVAAANAGVERVTQASKKASKELGDAGKQGEKTGGIVANAFNRASQGIENSAKRSIALGESLEGLGGSLKKAFVPATAAIAAFTAAIAFGDQMAEQSHVARTAAARLQVDISGAKAAFGGYVSEVKLAQIANKGFALGVISNGNDLARLSAGVRALAEDLGADSTELLDNAMTGIGRKSALILDNLGVLMDQAKAEEMYSASLGKTVAQLTAYEKSQAFAKAAIMEIEQAARKSTKANDALSDSWRQAKVSLEDFKNSGFGFDMAGGKIRETLRELDSEVLELFGSRKWEDIKRINAALHESGLNYEQIKEYLIETNNIETGRGGQMNREQRLQLEAALVEMAAEGLRHQDKAIKNAERLEKLAAAEERAKAEGEAVAEMEHEVNLLRAMGGAEKEILEAERQVLQLRLDQAEAAERVDDSLVKQLTRELELLEIKQLFGSKAKGGRGGGTTAAEREQAAGERLLQQMDQEIQRRTLLAELSGKSAESAARISQERRNLARAELDLEQRVLEKTKARDSVERIRNENRLAAIAAERELIDLEEKVEAEEEVNRLIREAVELSTLRASQEAAAVKRAQERVAIERNDQQAAVERDAEIEASRTKSAVRRLDIQREKEADLARIARARLADEQKAAEAAFDAKEAALRAEIGGDALEKERRQEEFRQLAHEREISRLQYEQQIRRNLEAEKAAMMQAERARFEAQISQLTEGLGQVQQFVDEATGLFAFFQQRANAEADAQLAHHVAMLEAKGQAQRENFDREIEAAKGNVALQNEIRRKQARTEAALRKQIELAQAEHADRRKRQEMRSAGWQLGIVSAVEGVKAIAAAASFNYVEALLHGAASTAAGIQAAMLLSGRIPGGGAVAALNAGAGAGMSGDTSQEYGDPSDIPGSVPGRAARRESATARESAGASGGTVFNGPVTIQAWGSIDNDVTVRLAREINKAPYSVED